MVLCITFRKLFYCEKAINFSNNMPNLVRLKSNSLAALLFSILFCFTIFTLILQTIAPQGQQGKISPIFKKLCPNLVNRFNSRKKSPKRIISV